MQKREIIIMLLLKTELNLLKSQINPHFFFNTLNNLYGLAVEKSDKTEHVIHKLAEMMRFTIYDGRKDSVSIKDELNYLNNYVELNMLRYQNTVDIQIQKDIENENQRIPPLLFINLLENAFKHGAESIIDCAYIRYKLKTTSKKIEFEIENNFELTKPKKHAGIGMENLRRRLDLLFPDRHEFTVEISESVYKTKVSIYLTWTTS